MIVITGASGLLGANLVFSAKRRFSDIAAVHHRHPVHFPSVENVRLDLTDQKSVSRFIEQKKPDIVIHCAGCTSVDECEAHPEKARLLNASAARHLAEASRKAGSRLVYVSTDSVFSGDRGGYSEVDEPRPVNAYAQTKWEGERWVENSMDEALILRTNIYGWNIQPKESLAEWIVNRLERGESVPGFHDVWFSPILVNDLSEIILDLIEAKTGGIYHAAGSHGCSKYQFAQRLASLWGVDEERIERASIQDSPLKAPRPLNTTLQTAKIEKALGRTMPDVDSGLRRFKILRESGFVDALKKCLGE
ncbi:MAG: SDR family oxidoreductase [Candidatus Hinthialibacter sp.]